MVAKAKYLGITFQEKLTWNPHISLSPTKLFYFTFKNDIISMTKNYKILDLVCGLDFASKQKLAQSDMESPARRLILTKN